MNKFKRKRRLNVIVAALMLVLFAGSAFALTSTGPLIFNGTASVDASLVLLIVNYDILENPGGLVHDIHPTLPRPPWPGATVIDWYDVIFTAPGQHILWEFTIQNLGSTPARIEDIVSSDISTGMWVPPGHVPVHEWGYNFEVVNRNDLIGEVLMPLETREMRVRVEWNPVIDHRWTPEMTIGPRALPIRFTTWLHYAHS